MDSSVYGRLNDLETKISTLEKDLQAEKEKNDAMEHLLKSRQHEIIESLEKLTKIVRRVTDVILPIDTEEVD